MKDAPVTPQAAATIIILRAINGGEYETLLLKRHRGQAFMGGAHVFPGGKMDVQDQSPFFYSQVYGLDGSQANALLQEPELSESEAVGLFIAAVRETFEEAGILLTYDSHRRLLDFSDSELARRFREYRVALQDKAIAFEEMIAKENLRPALDLIVPYAHWITPTFETRRFDTRFLLARLPAGQTPVHDNRELTESLWINPKAARRKHEQGEITLMPPTLKSLEELSVYSSLDEVFRAAREKVILPILPQGVNIDGEIAVILPHDPEYNLSGYKQPPCPHEPSRIILKDGRWRTEFA